MVTDEEVPDPVTAAALLQATTRQAQRSMAVRTPLLYGAWGVAWLIGLLAMWFSVRGQAPYRGPSAGAGVLLATLIFGAIAATVLIVVRATRGIEGPSEIQGRMFGLAWPIGFATLIAVDGAVARQGASDTVIGLIGAVGPLLVTSLIYVVGAAVWLDWPMFAMGAWLAVVAAVGAWTGPVDVLLVEGLAGGGGFLVMAGYLAMRGRA